MSSVDINTQVQPLFFDPELLESRLRRLSRLETISLRLLPASLLSERNVEFYITIWRDSKAVTPLFTSLVSQRSLNPIWYIDAQHDEVVNPVGDMFGVLKSFVVRVHMRSDVLQNHNQKLPFVKYAFTLADLIRLANPNCGQLPPKMKQQSTCHLSTPSTDLSIVGEIVEKVNEENAHSDQLKLSEDDYGQNNEDDDSSIWTDPVILEQEVDLEKLVPGDASGLHSHGTLGLPGCISVTSTTPLALRLQFTLTSGNDEQPKLLGLPHNTPLHCPIALKALGLKRVRECSETPYSGIEILEVTPSDSSSVPIQVGSNLNLEVYQKMQSLRPRLLKQIANQGGRNFPPLKPDSLVESMFQLAERRAVLRELWILKQQEAKHLEKRVAVAFKKRREILIENVTKDGKNRLCQENSRLSSPENKPSPLVAHVQLARSLSHVETSKGEIHPIPCSKECYLLAPADLPSLTYLDANLLDKSKSLGRNSAESLAHELLDPTLASSTLSVLSSPHLCLCARRRRVITLRRLAARARHAAEDIRDQLTALRNGALRERALILKSATSSLSSRMEDMVVSRQSTLLSLRNTHLNSSTSLALRRRQLIRDLIRVLPITSGPEEDYRSVLAAAATSKANVGASPQAKAGALAMLALNSPRRAWYIRGVHLPSTPAFITAVALSNEHEETACALGYVVMLVLLLSQYLSIQLRYSLVYGGSRSSVCDEVYFSRAFPLFIGPKAGPAEERKFEHALEYLSSNIRGLIAARVKGWRSLELEQGNILQNLQVLLQHEVPVD